jgi:hypothetical protein
MSARTQMFRTARSYHAALARYCRAVAGAEDVEDATQQVIGASLRYRAAINEVIAASPQDNMSAGCLRALRLQLHCLTRQYNVIKRSPTTREQAAAVV